ncbi:MAG: alpha/beta fold hydrolase [Myxococcales bacterium]|nr:alpha/beta fold hydrolase [Myxococcales bacterium]
MGSVSHPLLPPALDGDRREMTRRAGRLSYYVAGEGPPLLLIHSINAAASAFEMKPVFDRLIASFRVYALDLPGFGFSDRSPRRYDVRLYTDSLHDILELVASESEPNAAVQAIALSLSSEFLARAATERGTSDRHPHPRDADRLQQRV